MKVSDYIIKYLERLGVRYIYGYTGGAITHIVDSIYLNKEMTFVSMYNEQAASYAASAASKYTSRLNVAIATSGPGITNMITGIAESYFDSTPVLFISGQVNTYDFKYDSPVRQKGFQETDILAIVGSITKYCSRINTKEDVEPELKKAVSIALSGRKGPVLLDIPMNIQRQEIDVSDSGFDLIQVEDDSRDDISLMDDDFRKILSMIQEAKLPLILAGGGCSSRLIKDDLVRLSERLCIPVVVSLMGKDSFPHNHRLFGGFIGSYGNRYGNILLADCDLLIVLGSRLDSRQTGNITDIFKDKRIIWVDIDRNEMECNRIKPTLKFNSDVKDFVEELLGRIIREDISLSNPELVKALAYLKEKYAPITEIQRPGKEDWHYRILKKISGYMRKDDVVCVDVGQNQMLAAQVLDINEDQRFINSGGMAPMGYALPAAIGISTETKKRCIVICGDGGLQMNIQELNSLKHADLPVIIVILNNKSLGMIKQFQELYFDSRYFGTGPDFGYHSCDFKKISEAYGIPAFRIGKKDINIEEQVLDKIFVADSGPAVLELDIDYQTHIFPKLNFDKSLDRISPELPDEEYADITRMMKRLKGDL